MNLTFIGTSSGRTVTDRFHSSILIKSDNHQLLIDAGDGVSKAFFQLGLNYNSVDSIIISHFHPDHVSGLPMLLNQMKLTCRTEKLTVYVQQDLLENLKELLHLNLIYLEQLEFHCEITPFQFDDEIQLSESLKIQPKQNQHLTKAKLPPGFESIVLNSASFLINVENKTVIYTADIGHKDDLFLFGSIKPDYYIVDSQHIDFEYIYKLHKEHGYQNILLTHINFETEHTLLKKLNELPSEEKLNLRVAFDGLVLE